MALGDATAGVSKINSDFNFVKLRLSERVMSSTGKIGEVKFPSIQKYIKKISITKQSD